MIICANLWTKKLSGKESRELAKQAVITKCRGYINAEPSRVFIKIKPWISVPKKTSPPHAVGAWGRRKINRECCYTSKKQLKLVARSIKCLPDALLTILV